MCCCYCCCWVFFFLIETALIDQKKEGGQGVRGKTKQQKAERTTNKKSLTEPNQASTPNIQLLANLK